MDCPFNINIMDSIKMTALRLVEELIPLFKHLFASLVKGSAEFYGMHWILAMLTPQENRF
jgi:hypothetical protein